MKKIHISFTMLLTICAIVSIYFSIGELTHVLNIQSSKFLICVDISIWIIFAVEYFYKFRKANNKKEYFAKNIPDLLSTIPVPIIAIFYNNPWVYALRLIRLISFFDEIIDSFRLFARHKGVAYATYLLLIVVTVSSFGIYTVEKGTTVSSLGDAFWWAIVTVSTTGFGDISPKTPIGRIIATILMFTGIAVFGVIMSTIGNMLTEKKKDDIIIIDNKIDVSCLNEEDIKFVIKIIDNLQNK